MWDTDTKQCGAAQHTHTHTHIAVQDGWQSCGFSVQCQIFSLCHLLTLCESARDVQIDSAWNLCISCHRVQRKQEEEELKKAFESLNTYSIDLISYSYASWWWWIRPGSLCAETEEEPHTCNRKWAKAQTHDTYGRKQHWKLTQRLTVRHEIQTSDNVSFK